jgi:hypothetical protein
MPSTKIPTSAQDVEINGWFIEEAVVGTTPTNGTWKNIGIISTLNEDRNADVQEIPIVGSPDYYARLDMGKTKGFNMKYYLVNDIEFISYCVALQAGTGTPGKSVSVLQKQLINGASMYILYTGCFPDSGTFNVERVPSVDLTYRALGMTLWIDQTALNALIGTSYVPPSALTDIPFTNLDAGTDPLSINGTPLDINRMTVGVNRNVRERKPLGNADPTFLGVGNRRFTVSLETWAEDNDLMTWHENFTAQDAIIKFSLSPNIVQLELADVDFDTYSRGLDSGNNEYQMESVSGAARSAELTSTPV